MGNVLSEDKRQEVLALGRLGWSLRRIEEATAVRRETASAYLKAAGLTVRGRGRPSSREASKPATTPVGVSTDSNPAKAAIVVEVSTDPAGSKPAISEGVSTDSGAVQTEPRPERAPSASACEPFRELVEEALGRGRNAMAIWQDLCDDHGYRGRYASVRRYVRKLRGSVNGHQELRFPDE